MLCGTPRSDVFVMFFIFFFFFKQKTAYEMRISDWSSDVCSSDLRWRVQRVLRLAAELVVRAIGLADGFRRIIVIAVVIDIVVERIAAQQIGRASCRERVCQYV